MMYSISLLCVHLKSIYMCFIAVVTHTITHEPQQIYTLKTKVFLFKITCYGNTTNRDS